MKKYLIGTIVLLSFPFLMNAQSSNTSCLNLTSNLNFGMSGANVTALQNNLLAGGYFNTDVTGYFGSITFAAVKAYQSAHNIDSTGSVGSLTRAALEAETCSGNSTSYTGTQTQVVTNTQCPAGYTCTPKAGTTNPSAITTSRPSVYVPGSYYNSLTRQTQASAQAQLQSMTPAQIQAEARAQGITLTTAQAQAILQTQTNSSNNSTTANTNSTVNSSTVVDSISSASDVSANQGTTINAITSVTTSETDASCPPLAVCVR
jgi:peptidoglycan hydrolase-like protein with peptidoglycan-binding domain